MKIKNSKIWLVGSSGMLGSSIKKLLIKKKYKFVISKKSEVNCLNAKSIEKFIKINKPQIIINCAARVGGIEANRTHPAEFIYENTLIGLNIINSAFKLKIDNIINFGSSCTYPNIPNSSISEEMLGNGFPEITNQWYSFAKLNTLKMAEAYNQQYGTNYLSIIPTNLYGPGDNFNSKNSHVIPALLKKFYNAKKNNEKYVKIWGSGKPVREFLYVDDAALGTLFILEKYKSKKLINLGSNEEISIKKLANKIANIVNFKGKIIFDNSKPDGAKKKLLNSNKINKLGWRPKTNLSNGILKTFIWYKKNY